MDKQPNWITTVADGVIIKLRLQPNAAHSKISGEYGDGDGTRLKIRIAAPPVDGAANKELVRFFKKLMNIPSFRIHIIRGETSRSKDILLEGVSLSEVLAKLG